MDILIEALQTVLYGEDFREKAENTIRLAAQTINNIDSDSIISVNETIEQIESQTTAKIQESVQSLNKAQNILEFLNNL